jgi:Ax21 family sulfation-dependent quorum factor
MNFKTLFLALALALPFAANADDLSYSYFEAGATRVDPDGAGSENGFGFGGAGALTENWHVFGNYRSYDVSVLGTDFDVDGWNLGLGYNMGISDSMDFFGRASYEKFDADIGDGNGWGLQAGVRNAFGKHFEGGASLKYTDIEDSDNTSVELYGQYKFGEWGIVGTLSFSDDGNEFFIGPRISF